MTTPAWIGLGSNLGDREAMLDAAVAALAETPGRGRPGRQLLSETRPVGGPPGQGPFLNAAARLRRPSDPHELLGDLQRSRTAPGGSGPSAGASGRSTWTS